MPTENAFPGNTVIESFALAERQLVEVLRVVPYCTEHEKVWSPVLTQIMLDVCSQIDSLCKTQGNTKKPANKLDMRDYFRFWGEVWSRRWVVFWGDEPQQLAPFSEWADLPSYDKNTFVTLDWWHAHNDVKHNRLTNRTEGTLRNATHALAALFLVILRFKPCHDYLVRAGWVSGRTAATHVLYGALTEEAASAWAEYVAVESQLFTYPVGWSKRPVRRSDTWQGGASVRFHRWFDDLAAQQPRPGG